MKIEKTAIGCVFFLCMSLAMAAPEWIPVTKAAGMLMSVDKGSVVELKSGDRKAWLQYLFAQPEAAQSGEKYTRQVSRAAFNCRERTWKVQQVVSYDDDNDSKIVESLAFESAEFKFREVVPGSVAEAALEYVCSKRSLK